MSSKSKVALITGGAKNLGAEIAREFAKAGITGLAVHYNSPKTKSDADSLAEEFNTSYPNVTLKFYSADLTMEPNVNKLFESVKKDFGKLDIMVNTVGMVLKKPMSDITEEEYDQMFAVNSKAAFFCLKAGGKHVSDGGKLVTLVTSLLAAYTGSYTSYGGSKAPVEDFTRGLSKELMARQISVNAVAPGPMDTPFFYPQESPEAVAFHKSNAMGGRLTGIKDVAPLIRFLVTEGYWINGQTIFINGGYTTR